MFAEGRGSYRFLCLQTVLLLKWCQRYQITFQAAHLQGADNKLADALSRKTSAIKDKPRIRGSSVEWQLNPIVCRALFNRLQRPLMDLFASSQNNQLLTFCSWGDDPMAFAQDAMTISWDMTLAYAFPPIALIPRVLEMITNSKSCDITRNQFDMYSIVSQSWCAFWQKNDMLLKWSILKSSSVPKPQRKAYHLKDTALLCDFLILFVRNPMICFYE